MHIYTFALDKDDLTILFSFVCFLMPVVVFIIFKLVFCGICAWHLVLTLLRLNKVIIVIMLLLLYFHLVFFFCHRL